MRKVWPTRIGAAEELARERLVDDRHLRRRERVAFVEIAARDQRRAHGAEIARARRG